MTIFTPPGIIASSALFRAKGSPKAPDKLEFYLHLLLTTASLQSPDGKRLKDALDDRCRQAGGSNFLDAVKRGEFHYPLRRVDPERARQKGWPSNITYDLNIKSGADYRPKIVDEDLQPVIDNDQVYNGRIARATVSLFAYGRIKGVGIGLGNVQLLGHGTRLAGSRGDGSEFGEAGALAPADVDLSELV